MKTHKEILLKLLAMIVVLGVPLGIGFLLEIGALRKDQRYFCALTSFQMLIVVWCGYLPSSSFTTLLKKTSLCDLLLQEICLWGYLFASTTDFYMFYRHIFAITVFNVTINPIVTLNTFFILAYVFVIISPIPENIESWLSNGYKNKGIFCFCIIILAATSIVSNILKYKVSLYFLCSLLTFLVIISTPKILSIFDESIQKDRLNNETEENSIITMLNSIAPEKHLAIIEFIKVASITYPKKTQLRRVK